MKPLAHPLLADENIHRDVISGLRTRGSQVLSVHEVGLAGSDDEAILRAAHRDGRVVLTHDSDFGRLALHAGVPFTGIIFVRPGHISPSFVLETLMTIDRVEIDAKAPFLLVVERRGDSVRARLR